MSSQPAPPSRPALLALILTIRTRAGPQLVHHHPPTPALHPAPVPDPGTSTPRPAPAAAPAAAAGTTSHARPASRPTTRSPPPPPSSRDSSRSTSSADDNGRRRPLAQQGRGAAPPPPPQRAGAKGRALRAEEPLVGDESGDDEYGHGHEGEGAERGWDAVMGHEAAGLAKVLAPLRPEGGAEPEGSRRREEWKRRNKRFEVGVGDDGVVFLGYPVFVRADGRWRKARRKGEEEKRGRAGELLMYHVVFVMRPQPLQYRARVGEMYEHVVRKYAKALKYEQARSGWVGTESARILEMKAAGREQGTPVDVLWPKIMEQSALARSMAHVFEAISTGQVAHVTIGETVDASMQIPQTTQTAAAPTPANPQTPGLWVTTASMVEADRSLSPHAALLLLEDKDSLIAEIEGNNRELAAPLAYFIREVTPTKSIQKLAAKLSLRLPDLQYLARHLIHWRKARAVPPLHIRDVYVVSPLADMAGFAASAGDYERRFPGLPSLLKMLQVLSARPIPYGYLIPSRDHKAPYMDMLAWLLSRKWVTQLRAFAWIRVSADIKIRAAARLRKEDPRRHASRTDRASNKDSTVSSVSVAGAFDRRSGWDDLGDARIGRDKTAAVGLLSPMLKPFGEEARSDNASVSSTRTAVHAKNPSPLARMTAHEPPFQHGNHDKHAEEHSTDVSAPDVVAQEPSIILSPQRANKEESFWLALIEESLTDKDLKGSWQMLCRYLDGQTALEEIAGREGLKRSKVATLIGKLEREGLLCMVRHW